MATTPAAPDPSPSSPPASGGSSAGTGAVPAPGTPPEAAATPAEETQTLDQFEAATSTRTDESGRDEKGRFVRPRHRARSQQAGSEDVPRIAELTRRLRDTEAERDALKGGVARTPAPPPAPVSTPPAEPSRPTGSVPPTAAPSPYPPVKAATEDPEPDAEKYTDLTLWMREHARWSAREELRVARAEYDRQTAETQQKAETARLSAQWRERVTAAKAKYPDFEQVALLAPTSIPQGSILDAWIIEHKFGADVLYHFQKSPTELQQLLALPLLDQVEALTL